MFRQQKLSGVEWGGMEVPVQRPVKEVLEFMSKAFTFPELVENKLESMTVSLKMPPSEGIDALLCKKYFPSIVVSDKKIALKKADQIRVNASDKTMGEVYEVVLMKACGQAGVVGYYILWWLTRLSVKAPNRYVMAHVRDVLRKNVPSPDAILQNAAAIFESPWMADYGDMTLYEHQKLLFQRMHSLDPALILYLGATGTGKTMSAVTIAENRPVIFVTGARHIALTVAQMCVAQGVKLAVAFGCEGEGDIRLHYSAVKEGEKDPRTGRYRNVNNANGVNVRMMVSDIRSYPHAMRYMARFNSPAEIVLFWDDPTIGMDQSESPLHELVAAAWQANCLPTVVLSSATLPPVAEIRPILDGYQAKFQGQVHSINTMEYPNTVKVLDVDNRIIMPHHCCQTPAELARCVENILQDPSLMRYIDLKTAAEFARGAPFAAFSEVTVASIKRAYLTAVGQAPWPIADVRAPEYASTSEITGKDAWTITAPSIYMTNDIGAAMAHCLACAGIPDKTMDALMENLKFNRGIHERLEVLQKDREDANAKDDKKDKKMADGRVNPAVRAIQAEMDHLRGQLRRVFLADDYIPNTASHMARFRMKTRGFAAYIEEPVATAVLSLDLDERYKLLLLMGVGVLDDQGAAYQEVIKQMLAQEQMFLLIASPDYMFGTNYQFSHAYVADPTLTHSMMKQAFGRVGRSRRQTDTVRLQMKEASRLFFPDNYPEAVQMNRLFK